MWLVKNETMPVKYVFLQNPGHNRVYYNSADQLALSELQIASTRLSVPVESTGITDLKGIRYLQLETAEPLTESDLALLSRLSFAFAIFRLDQLNGEDCLIPLARFAYEYLDSKVSSILKYKGKTNELFTRMMINVGMLSSSFHPDDRISLLDPVAGKGTTLFEAAVYGYDGYGIELDPKVVHEAVVFFRKFLEDDRLKHRLDEHRVAGTNKNNAIMMAEFSYALTKEDFVSGNLRKTGLVNGDTQDAFQYFKKPRFHLVVGDLPYGISHGSTNAKAAGKPSRNPAELLRQSVTEWSRLLIKGGAMVLAWNTFVLDKHSLSKIVESTGLQVKKSEAYNGFEHQVDKAIRRDILVAVKY